MMATAKITSKGRVTIPRSVREHLHVAEGDRIDFHIEENGEVRLTAARSVRELCGILHRPGRQPVSVEEMNAAISDRSIDREGTSPSPMVEMSAGSETWT